MEVFSQDPLMILPIVKYGHPVLRQRGRPIDVFDQSLENLVDAMLDTMYDADGVGLAAQQIGKALQLTVVDVSQSDDRPSSMKVNNEPVDLQEYMPLVLVNPLIDQPSSTVSGPEGCLSFPEIYADIDRPEQVRVRAQDHKGNPVEFVCDGLLAKAIQHEVDHLNGILFIDRMSTRDKDRWRPQLESLQDQTKQALKAD